MPMECAVPLEWALSGSSSPQSWDSTCPPHTRSVRSCLFAVQSDLTTSVFQEQVPTRSPWACHLFLSALPMQATVALLHRVETDCVLKVPRIQTCRLVAAVGGILGFALVYEGANGVTWAVRDPGAFPPYKGVIAIVLTWFIAPILTGLVSAVIFLLVRTLILRRSFAYNASFWLLPVLVLITVFINIFFVFTKVRNCFTYNVCPSFSVLAPVPCYLQILCA